MRPTSPDGVSPLDLPNLCFLGTSIQSGTGLGDRRRHGAGDVLRRHGQEHYGGARAHRL